MRTSRRSFLGALLAVPVLGPMLAPFVRTPVNIFDQVLEHAPELDWLEFGPMPYYDLGSPITAMRAVNNEHMWVFTEDAIWLFEGGNPPRCIARSNGVLQDLSGGA